MWAWIKKNKEIFYILLFAFILITWFQFKSSTPSPPKPLTQLLPLNYNTCPKPCKNCVKLSQNCTSCIDNLILLEIGETEGISYGFYLNDYEQIYCRKCVCPEKDKYLTDEFECKVCDQNCKECGEGGNCLNCLEGWFAEKEGDIKKCHKCNQLCKVCVIEADLCLSCQDGFFLQNSACCPFNCKHCSSTNNCSTCKNGFYLQEQIEASTFNICLPCNEACKTCFGSRISECLSCNNQKYIYPDKHICTITCADGYYAYADELNRQCLQCHESCAGCEGPGEDQCTKCVNQRNFYQNEEQKQFCCDQNCIKCTGPLESQCIKTGFQTSHVNISSEYQLFKEKQYQIPQDENYMKGMTFVSDRYCPNVPFGSDKALLSLKQIRSTGATWVAIVVTEYQYATSSVDVYPIYDPIKMSYYTHITSTIPDLKFIIKAAHKLGMKVMLKPHIDLQSNGQHSSPWRGDIGGWNSTELIQWFSSYTAMILKYASLAEALEVELFSISCELVAANQYDSNWRELIQKVRDVYTGNLTASANPGEEYGKKYWDALDYIGVDAYYMRVNIGKNETYIYEKLEGLFKGLKQLSQSFKKPLLITETGFCSSSSCTRNAEATDAALKTQAAFYKAFLQLVTKNSDWIKGIFFWSWNSDPAFGGDNDPCISPQYKPAEEILREFYGGTERIAKPDYPAECACTV